MKLNSLFSLAAVLSMSTLSPASAPRMSDNKFVQDMAVANMAEIQLGRLAADRGSSDFVKGYGKMMMKDH